MISRYLLVLAVALAFAGCGQEAPKPMAKKDAPKGPETLTVKIGSDSPLTGPQAHIGIDIRNGVELAIEDANAANIEIGGKKVKFELAGQGAETSKQWLGAEEDWAHAEAELASPSTRS